VFFVSHDGAFFIKTVRKEEVRALLAMLPAYYAHVAAHPDTRLVRFYGVHRVKPKHGRKVNIGCLLCLLLRGGPGQARAPTPPPPPICRSGLW
jgi:1-phosphatidylinositol-4-phosphate 5-kinase